MTDHAPPNPRTFSSVRFTPDGLPFLTGELPGGDPITDFCDRARFTIPRRLDLFIAVCTAVQHAHHKGIVHGNLQPAHVLIGHADSAVMVGGFAATPPRADPDTRADVHALGALLHELLTGSPPDPRSPSPSAHLRHAADTLGPAAASRATDPAALRRIIRGDLDWITIKCLEPDPSRRYQTASEIAQDLRRHMRADPVEAVPPRADYRFEKFMQRHRTGVIVALLGLTLLIGALAWTGYTARAASEASDTNRRLARNAQAALDLAQESLKRTEAFAVQAWQAAPLEAGEVFFASRGCNGCHTVNGMRWTGPTMKDLYGSTIEFADGGTAVADAEFLEKFILGENRRDIKDFPPLMPIYQGQIEPGVLRAIILYIMSLSEGHAEETRRQARDIQREHLQDTLSPRGIEAPKGPAPAAPSPSAAPDAPAGDRPPP